MPADLKCLIGLVKKSKLLTAKERKSWLKKMEKMSEEQLGRLKDILEKAEKLDWEKELPKYEAAVGKAEAIVHAAFPITSPH